ncbi:MAG TPA: hypothetical protein VE398_08770 [Acidobacteriota bacterium]|nr:hypothetical protein [Acidobacteriota bacterium]
MRRRTHGLNKQSPLIFEPTGEQLLDKVAELPALQLPEERQLHLVVGVLPDIGSDLFKVRMPALSRGTQGISS